MIIVKIFIILNILIGVGAITMYNLPKERKFPYELIIGGIAGFNIIFIGIITIIVKIIQIIW